jgi:hypothetical protein
LPCIHTEILPAELGIFTQKPLFELMTLIIEIKENMCKAKNSNHTLKCCEIWQPVPWVYLNLRDTATVLQQWEVKTVSDKLAYTGQTEDGSMIFWMTIATGMPKVNVYQNEQ